MLKVLVPFKTWWKCRKVFKAPRIKFFFTKRKVLDCMICNPENYKEAREEYLNYIFGQSILLVLYLYLGLFIGVYFTPIITWFSIIYWIVFIYGFSIWTKYLYNIKFEITNGFHLSSPGYSWLHKENGFTYYVSSTFIQNYTKWYKPFIIDAQDVGWKLKWDEVRYERKPFFSIILGTNEGNAFQFGFVLLPPKNERAGFMGEDFYWEMMLTYLHLCDKDLNKAKEKYSSIWESSNGKNYYSWDENYLKNDRCL